jgi:hypothetical protein
MVVDMMFLRIYFIDIFCDQYYYRPQYIIYRHNEAFYYK